MPTSTLTPAVHPPSQGEQTSPAAHLSPGRDRFLDVLRVFAVLAVVGQHWLMPVLSYDGSTLTTGNALTTDGAWAITWVSQVMPLVFFAGGAAAAMSLRRRHLRFGESGATSSTWLADRLRRLTFPVLPLAAVWLPLPHVLAGMGIPVQPVAVASQVAGQLLWFLAAYVLVTALTAPALRVHRRWRGAEIVVMTACAVGVDIVRFAAAGGTGGTPADVLGYANVLFVWVAVYQAGIMYASGRLDRLRGRTAWWTASAGFGVAGLAVALGPYPASMIGMPGAPMSNMNPPTAVLLAVAVGQLGVALALRRAIETWASAIPVTRALDALSRRLMTIYVWHTPALVAVAGVAVLGLGIDTPEPFTDQWREQMPWWLLALGGVLAVLVRLFGRFEQPHTPTGSVNTGQTYLAAALAAAGLLTMTITGFGPVRDAVLRFEAPAIAAALVVVGTALLRIPRSPGSSTIITHARVEA